jgi:Flp pilus assembly protein TadD
MWMYASQWQHEKAVDHAMRAITLDSNDAKSLEAMALALIWDGRSDEAVDFTERMRRADPACVF